jgi:hypothetical protein
VKAKEVASDFPELNEPTTETARIVSYTEHIYIKHLVPHVIIQGSWTLCRIENGDHDGRRGSTLCFSGRTSGKFAIRPQRPRGDPSLKSDPCLQIIVTTF